MAGKDVHSLSSYKESFQTCMCRLPSCMRTMTRRVSISGLHFNWAMHYTATEYVVPFVQAGG